jgi:hypothetical protein
MSWLNPEMGAQQLSVGIKAWFSSTIRYGLRLRVARRHNTASWLDEKVVLLTLALLYWDAAL